MKYCLLRPWVLARGVVEVTWSRPFGDPGGGSGGVPLRVGASSTSYGWALGEAVQVEPMQPVLKAPGS